MRVTVNGIDTFVANGGKPFDASLPAVVLLHGAGFDHSAWALHSRWFAHHGYAVLAPDLPGHGKSGGAPLGDIPAMADFVAAMLDVVQAKPAKIVGHSMGSLIAIETAARYPEKVSSIALIGTGTGIPVGEGLLNAAKANDHAAIDMVSLWGLGGRAKLGGSLASGLWMLGGSQRVLESMKPGVLHSDLAACNAYKDTLTQAANVKVPVTIVLGERDQMIPAKSGRALAQSFASARVVVIPDTGHSPLSERPDETLLALQTP